MQKPMLRPRMPRKLKYRIMSKLVPLIQLYLRAIAAHKHHYLTPKGQYVVDVKPEHQQS